MGVTLRKDERQWLRYDEAEIVATMRAAEAWSMRVGGAYLQKLANRLPVEAADTARRIGDIMMKVSDARMEYLGTTKYTQSLEELTAASAFDTLSRIDNGDFPPPDVVVRGLDAVLAALVHIDARTSEAGFLNPERLESILTRGDR